MSEYTYGHVWTVNTEQSPLVTWLLHYLCKKLHFWGAWYQEWHWHVSASCSPVQRLDGVSHRCPPDAYVNEERLPWSVLVGSCLHFVKRQPMQASSDSRQPQRRNLTTSSEMSELVWRVCRSEPKKWRLVAKRRQCLLMSSWGHEFWGADRLKTTTVWAVFHTFRIAIKL